MDIPNANTIVIDRADLFGLADLYQLRGRVGRSQTKAYAYLMLPRDLMGAARKRVSAIKQYSDLGSGFKVAMRDLEIRGAGNLLGTAQSGHIIAVGFDLYCKLLRQAVETISGSSRARRATGRPEARFSLHRRDAMEPRAGRIGRSVSSRQPILRIPARGSPAIAVLPKRRIAKPSTGFGPNGVTASGPLPVQAENALLAASIRIEAARRRITMVEVRERRLMLTQRRELLQKDGRFPRLTASDPDSSLREILSSLETIPCP